MKRLVMVLVAVNVVFLGWNVLGHFAPEDAPVLVEPDADDRAPRIELLAEVDTRELRERRQAPPEPARVVVAPSWPAEPTGEPMGEPMAQPMVQRTAEQTAEQTARRMSQPASGPIEEPVREPLAAPRAESIAADAGDPAAEADSEDAAIATVEGPARPDPAPVEEVLAAAALPAPTVSEPSEPLCFSVGPLTTPEEVAAMRTWLDERGGEATLRTDERRELALYWVFFPPSANRAQALERFEQLSAEGIGDIYIIPRGDMANAISLGVFSRRDTLERRLRELRTKGHEPAITPRYRITKASWFDVALDGDFDFRASGFADAFPAIEMSPGACTTRPDAELAGAAG